jgi:DNA-binding NarL/FixJ family response regulator
MIVALEMQTGAFDGLSFIHKIRLHDQRTPILVYTNQKAPVIASRVLEVGATGYALKDSSSDQLLRALEKVLEGKPFISYELAPEIAIMEIRGTKNPLKRLTVRELQAPPLSRKANLIARSQRTCMSATRRSQTSVLGSRQRSA